MKFGPQELKVMRRYPTSLCYENRVLVETIECYDAQIAHLVKVTERQSEMLALALKEKNDAIEDRFRMSTQLDLRGKELSATRDNIPFRFIDGGVRTPDAVRALTGAWQSQNKELEKLRPPEPKFRVGQIVMASSCGPFKIDRIEHKQNAYQYYMAPNPAYSAYNNTWCWEFDLRALTEREAPR